MNYSAGFSTSLASSKLRCHLQVSILLVSWTAFHGFC